MMSPVSGRNMMANRVQSPMGGAKAAGAGAAGENPELTNALAELEQLLKMLMEMLKQMGITPPGAEGAAGAGAPAAAKAAGGGRGGGGGGGGGGMDGFSPAGAQGAPAGMPALGGGGPAVNFQGIQVDPALAPALEQIANHPDGAKLLAAAKANGLTSISVNPGLNPDGGAGTEGLMIPGNGNPRIEIANPNSPNLIHVLAHELGHAATTGDGNSLLEEKTVDALGARIHRDLTGSNSTFNLDVGSYAGLAGNNGILNSLRGLGVRV